MARCMLCSSPAGDTDVVCPRCGGAVEDDGGDSTRIRGVDLTKVDEPPAAWPGEGGPGEGWPGEGWPGEAAGPPSAGFGPPSGPPPGPYGYGPQPGPGPYGYEPPSGPGAHPYGPPPGVYGYGAPAWTPGWGPGPAPPPQEGLAMAGFLTSLIGLVLAGTCLVPILACPVGAVLGHVALRRIEQNGTGGRGLALAGVIIGWIGTAILVLGTIAVVGVAIAGSSSSA